jgi:hypothetical protein
MYLSEEHVSCSFISWQMIAFFRCWSHALFAADIVASFMLQKTVSELSESTSKLEFDIYEEVGIPNSTVRHNEVHYLYSSCHTVCPIFHHGDPQIIVQVTINFLQPLGASNWTYVIFAIVPYLVHSTISPTWLSILRSSFMSLVVEQSTLHLTVSIWDLFKFWGV